MKSKSAYDMASLYRYLGPADLATRGFRRPGGTRISSSADILVWIGVTNQCPGVDGLVAATFVIDAQGNLLVADRRSEHVSCA